MHTQIKEKIFKKASLDSRQERFNRFGTRWKISPEIGKGKIKTLSFKSGIQIYIYDYNTSEKLVRKSCSNFPVFGFRFCIFGNTRLDMKCLKKTLIVKDSESGFFYFPSMEGSHEDMPGVHIYKVLILVKPSCFLSLMEDEVYKIPMRSKITLNDKQIMCDPFNFTGIITPSMRMILEQIIHCPYDGATRRIFIEAKAMELIACKLDQLKSVKHKPKNHSYLKSCDMDRMQYAGELLSKNIETPPNMLELAKDLGVSRSKLYNNFKQVHGISPMEYFRLKRIEKAGVLVKNKNMNLTQIAYSLGYSNSSHFAKTFREYFGIPPSRYR